MAAHVGSADGADLLAKKLIGVHLHKAIVVGDAALTKLVEARSDVVRFEENGGADLAEQGSFLYCVKEFGAYVAFIWLR